MPERLEKLKGVGAGGDGAFDASDEENPFVHAAPIVARAALGIDQQMFWLPEADRGACLPDSTSLEDLELSMDALLKSVSQSACRLAGKLQFRNGASIISACVALSLFTLSNNHLVLTVARIANLVRLVFSSV